MLLGKETDLNVQEIVTGATPLHIATARRHLETVNMLLEAGADGDILIRMGRNIHARTC